MGLDALDRHGQIEFDHVARLPVARTRVAFLEIEPGHGLAGHGHRAVAPAGDAQIEVKRAGLLWSDRDLHGPIHGWRVFCVSVTALEPLSITFPRGHVEVHEDGIAAMGVDVARDRGMKRATLVGQQAQP